jgi:4'-phosphopantetheinyl transferase
MPLYKEWNIGDHALAAIWKIEEPESFFKDQTGLDADIKNDKRRTEHLAGRFLLKYLEKDFPLWNISKDEHDKPRIGDDKFFFSISHSWPYVAAVIDPFEEAGIDIQTWHAKIEQIQHKFLSADEQDMFQNDPKLLALAWSAKEAAYKWNGRRGVDFIEHLPIQFFDNKGEVYEITIYFQMKNVPQMILIESVITIDFACSYVIRADNWAIY